MAARAVATRAQHLRRSQRRDGGPHHRLGDARASSVQEAGDFAAVAHSATLQSRVPFLHFFDGFRTSHELNTVTPVAADQLRLMIDEGAVRAHRDRGLDSDRPMIRACAEPRRVLPGPRGVQPVLRGGARRHPGTFDQLAALTGRSTTWSTTTARPTPTAWWY
ncbi:MAG: hypothetical protein R2713_14210 [Ilumatobacteraceae bacterium]